MALPPKLYQFLVGVFASLGSFLFGYDLGVIAGVLASETFVARFHPDDVQAGLVVSLFTVGGFGGAFLAGPLADRTGRRATLTIGSVIFLLGGSLQTGAEGLGYLWSGRFLAGMGVGVLVMVVPLYQAELAHPSVRGSITALQQFMLGLGAFVASWVTYGTYINLKTTSAQWRIPLGLQLVPAIVLAVLIWLFPESPRWLMDHGHNEKALATLARLHAHGDQNDAFVLAEYEQIKASIEYEHEHKAKSYMDLFTSRSSFRRLFICCSLQASVQLTGVSAIQYFSPTIYAQIGITPNNTLKYQGVSNLLALFGEICCILFIDRLGRRWPLICGNLFHMVTFIIATILLAKYPPGASVEGSEAGQWGFIVVTWLYNWAFSTAVGPLSWIIPSEVFDTKTRAKGVSIATMTSFAFNTMIGQVTPIAMTNIGYRFYYLFIACNLTNAIFFWLLLPETARKPLEEMNKIFSSSWIVVGQSRKLDANSRDLETRVNNIVEEQKYVPSHTEKAVDYNA